VKSLRLSACNPEIFASKPKPIQVQEISIWRNYLLTYLLTYLLGVGLLSTVTIIYGLTYNLLYRKISHSSQHTWT